MAVASVISIRIKYLALIVFILLLSIFTSKYSESGNYTNSQHGDPTSGVTRSSIDSRYSGFSRGNCAHCHEPHASLGGSEPAPNTGIAAGPDKVLLFSEEEDVCLSCHNGAIVPRDMRTVVNKPYRHPITDYSGRHTLSKYEYGQNGAPFRGTNRHAECVDCHEPHYIGKPGTAYHSYNTTSPANNNLVSNLLKGVWGVEPATEGSWLTPPTTFTELTTPGVGASKEYQVCFKCHSYYAFQDADGITTIIGPSGQTITDQSMEFSKNLKSVHPVRVPLNNQTGSYAPKALATSQLSAPWTTAPGSQTMWCSDCHNNDASSPVGPHGSNYKFMLSGTRKYWPASSTGVLFSLSDIRNNTNNWSTELFCVNCHPLYSGGTWMNNVHSQHSTRTYTPGNVTIPVYCVTCHSVIPHGSPRSRLIIYRSDPQPYVYVNGTVNFAALSGFKKASSPTGYQKTNCYSTVSGCTTHTNSGGYD